MAVNDPVAQSSTMLRGRIASITESARCAALIGFPENQNCGDHANWLGAIKLLSELGLDVVYSASWSSFDRDVLATRIGTGIIFLSSALFAPGLSPAILASLLISFPNRIVFLPEAAPANVSIASPVAAAIAAHPGLFILARDSSAKKAVEQALAVRPIEMAPPLSFLLGPQQREISPEYDIVWV